MKRKILILALLLLTILVFTGCAEVIIDAEITPENLVTYSYIMNFTGLDSETLNYEQLGLFLLDIQKYWEENGVDCETDISDTSMTLTGTMQKQCANREDAFNTLYEYMTNKISLFESVSLDYTGDFYSSSYTLNAKVDLTSVLDKQIYEVHPAMVTEDVDEFMQNITCKAIFRLPYTENEDSAEISLKETITDISFESSTDISVIGSVENIDNIKMEKQLKAKIIAQQVLIIVSAVTFIGALAFLLFMILSKRKKNPTEIVLANVESEKPAEEKKAKNKRKADKPAVTETAPENNTEGKEE